MADKKNQVSRRQFLNYTLTGVGGFMGAAMIAPMVGFAVDPLLKGEKDTDYVYVMDVNEITNEPQRKTFQVDQVDGWYESKVDRTAWVYKDENDEILALSPVCTHLGCTVDWNSNQDFPNEFYCPCHDGRYDKNGVNIPGTPPTEPLHSYDFQIQDGKLMLGKAKARKGA
ncbi:ubiquinol-cytochrome c reductase iron-sulfur subunit [Tenuibacillus multivorans]|uniref:Menaquinol:cytochrome c reductase iron-sulfur subunit n=1 Tax=Tenuibacillus multivorans TaxID=237069 RepID=A0A1H0CU99_9BACI|nr:ubiquinol-cytochrome c reductase iron-sulfur subunit [Tenuibacillus multivorans]GEL76163.1 menaquinol-cytochrome C reductase iron-sulfur subunit [Tenuibacillus multivorans]SDN61375.1 menaquinol-cytochrome c reductase iron-sulfur subunit [Tenuibacillus multivorans]